MPALTMVIALLLITVGVTGYFGSGRESATALIPAAFGLPLAVCGALATKEKFLKHSMHAAAVLALLGVLGTVTGVLALPSALAGTAERPAAVYAKSLMFLLCLTLVVFCVKSFIDVRRARAAAANESSSDQA